MKSARVLLAIGVGLLTLGLACEVAGRMTYFSRRAMSFWTPARCIWHRYYGQLSALEASAALDEVRVGLFGGSTLDPGLSDVDARLRARLAALVHPRPLVFVNAAVPAHGSRDSYFKYAHLRRTPVDLVILYDGINELRANAVPADVWRDEYSHYAWYDEVNFIAQHESWARLGVVAPFYLQHKFVALDRKWFSRGRKLPYNATEIEPQWLAYGATLKSPPVFRRNLERILTLAQQKQEPMLLMTFASMIPADYTRARFEAGQSSYSREGPAGRPVEMWGRPEDIRAGLAAHNRILTELAQRPGVWFVDQAALLDRDPANFVDVCHLSRLGAERFAAQLEPALVAWWAARQPQLAGRRQDG